MAAAVNDGWEDGWEEGWQTMVLGEGGGGQWEGIGGNVEQWRTTGGAGRHGSG